MALTAYHHPGGWTIVPIHYSMDPEKDVSWVVNERAKFPSQEAWDQEMELDLRTIAGVPAYGAWSDTMHLNPEMRLLSQIPLCLACDFNVSPMVWMVCQIFRDIVYVLDEIVGRSTSVPDLVTEFRNRYPTHTAALWVYGDAAGNNRNAQTAMSDYDLMRLALKGYPVTPIWKIPKANPLVKDRLAAMNTLLQNAEGRVRMQVHPRCSMFVQDMQEVVKDAHGGVLKVNNRENPYHERTHASDAVGYLAYREFPVALEVNKDQRNRPRAPRQYGKLLGEM